jgi:hypothetical protein
MVDLVRFHRQRHGHILLQERKPRIPKHIFQIPQRTGLEIIQTDDRMSLPEQAAAKMGSDESGASGYDYISLEIHYLRLFIHFLSESVQYGTLMPNVFLIFVLSKTEYAGLFTLLGNSSLWHG